MNKTSSTTLQEPPKSLGKIVLTFLFAAGIGIFFYFDLGQYLSLASLQSNRDQLLAYTESHFTIAASLFILVYITQTAFSLPGGAILTLAGGFLFGSFFGTLLVNIGATTGATLAFLAARYLLRDWIETKFGDRLGPIQAGFAQNAFSYLMTLRLIPAFPFFLVNLVSGLTRVNLGTYIAATALGIIPGSFVFAFAGRQLGTINSLSEIASPPVLLAFTFLGLLAIMPIVYRKLTGKNNPESLSP
ncbi:MAG: TVP38/TMEM64 family protein [Nitrospirales bacterium]|nr:TVP38/TMEM64 family protein [Nitrospira sp.]MDR4503033.1 TVP38/TMEM64 family protein [Nitrospirales bacterium]